MSPRGCALWVVWSVPLLNVVLWIAVAIRPPPRAPVVPWPWPLERLVELVLAGAQSPEPSASSTPTSGVAPSAASPSGRRTTPALGGPRDGD
jgi:hypothetical protein